MRFKGYKTGGKLPPAIKRHSPPVPKQVLSPNIDSASINTEAVSGSREISSKPQEQLIILDEVFFDINRAVLKEGFTGKLDSVIRFLETHPTFRIHISGHTDDRGERINNASLSRARAAAVASYLRRKQVAESRISFQGEGSSRPVASNDTVEGRKKNRRVEITITNE